MSVDETPSLDIQVVDEKILIVLPGTSLRVAYMKAPDFPGLAKIEWVPIDGDGRLTANEFEVLAWEAANAKARELGWIV